MASFPPPPVNTIDWNNIENYNVQEVSGHVESTFSKATGEWSPLRFVTDPYIRVHGLAPGLNYGQHALEGFKAFRMSGSPGNIALFRPERNAKRLQHSAEVLSMPTVPTDLFLRACRAAVALNASYVPPQESGGSLYVRPNLYGTSARLGLVPPDDFTFNVFVVPTGEHGGPKPVKALILDDFDRTAPKGTGHAKVGGNYAPVMRWSDRARSQGFGITLHLDSARHNEIDEFSTCAFLGVQAAGSGDDERVTIVVPESPCIIDSVTSDAVQGLARSNGWRVERRRVLYTQLPDFTEVIGAGTAVAMCPISSITRRIAEEAGLPEHPRVRVEVDSALRSGTETVTYLSDNQTSGGPIFSKLLTQLRDMQYGRIPDEFGWRHEISPQDLKIDGVDIDDRSCHGKQDNALNVP